MTITILPVIRVVPGASPSVHAGSTVRLSLAGLEGNGRLLDGIARSVEILVHPGDEWPADDAPPVGPLAGDERERPNATESCFDARDILRGVRSDGTPYALLGSFGAGDERAFRARVAAELGLPLECTFIVRHSGDAHLDVLLAVWDRGRLLLNDSRQAMSVQERTQRLNASDRLVLRQAAERRAVAEDRIAQELRERGFDVVRVPARFFRAEAGRAVEDAGFLPGKSGTQAGGRSFFVTRRSSNRRVEHAFLDALPEAPELKVYFSVDPAAAACLLAAAAPR